MAPSNKQKKGGKPKSSTGGSRPSPATQPAATAAAAPSVATPPIPVPAAIATTTTTTTTTTAAATVVEGCEPRTISARMARYDAKGIPWFIGAMRENLNQAVCRAEKAVKRTTKWQAANPSAKKAIVKAARSSKEQEERNLGYDWRDAARAMGFRAKGKDFVWKEGCPIYNPAGVSDPAEEEQEEQEEEEELSFSLADDEPTTKKRRRDDEDDDEDDPSGDYTKHYMSRSIPRQCV